MVALAGITQHQAAGTSGHWWPPAGSEHQGALDSGRQQVLAGTVRISYPSNFTNLGVFRCFKKSEHCSKQCYVLPPCKSPLFAPTHTKEFHAPQMEGNDLPFSLTIMHVSCY